jgi:hypothetical protein
MPGISDLKTPESISLVGVGDANSRLASRVAGLIEESNRAKRTHETDWKKFREYYEGEQWPDKGQRASWRVSNVINVSFANVETATAVVMSMMPELIASPANEAGIETADKVSSALKFLWKKLGLRKTVTLSLKDALLYGSGILKVTWNPHVEFVDDFVYEEVPDPKDENATVWRKKKGEDGKEVTEHIPIGEVSVRRVSPFHFNPDPLALSIDDAAYVVEHKEVDMDYIRRRWPEKADLVTPDTDGVPVLDKAWSSKAPTVAVNKDSATVPGSRQAGNAGYNRSQVTLYEVWVRNIGLLYDPNEKVNWKAEYEKYPHGRVLVMAGSTILLDIANPYEDGHWPYQKFDNVDRPDMFWGKSEIEPILALQDELNRRSSQIMESANLTANPKVAIPLGSGLDKDTIFTTKPGEKWPYRGSIPPSFVTPPQLPAYVPQSLDRTMMHVERVSGNYDMLSGARPQGVTAASAISSVKEMAETRPRMKMENLCDALREVGQMMVSRMRQHYDRQREFSILKEDGSGQVDFDKIYSGDLGGEYDINIDVGATLPSSQTILFQWAMSMFEAGIIDAPAVLDSIQFPKRDRIQQRMEEQKQADMQQQMEMAQMQQGPQGPQAPQPQGEPMPPGEFSMRGEQAPPPQEQGPQGPTPPAPPGDMPPEAAALMSQILEAANNGEGMPPEVEAMLGGQMNG